MRPAASRRWTLLPAGALAAALALSACSGGDSTTAVKEDPIARQAPAPAASLPAPVRKLTISSDVGEFFVTPKAGTPKTQVDGTVARLKAMAGVQSAEFKGADGIVDLQFRPNATKPQREAAVRQLAALGEVEEGI